MGTGYLTIETRTNLEALPVEGARVRVINAEGEEVYDLITNEFGQTETVPLETVDRELTFDPEYSGRPYLSYDLEVQAEGYESVNVSGVHIFDGEYANQHVTMIPMTESESSSFETNISIGELAVEMEGERDQIGTTLESRILRNVIIPDVITVHLGRPAANAQNVQVPFPDYVKNVACGEIYATWPQASLEANIYAIITFALNRIYTEWYRSQGYNFDITNNTAYDQYFVYGQTIYDSISTIVDRIFNQYVRREGQYAPYFTAFCNGTTAKCSGLSQWGTVSLANSGYNSFQILRYYYPNDIEVAETNIFTSVIESYPGTTLKTGDTGLDVEIIQEWLTKIRRNYPGIPAITDSPGVFGLTTQAAVRTFQSVFGLSVDGIVGKTTWYKMSYIYVAITRLAELDTEGVEIGIGTVPPSSVLRQGDAGIDVVTLQYILSYISQFYPSIPAIVQNGIFSESTAQAVIAFQNVAELSADGVVDQSTWRALYDTYWGIKDNTTSPEPEENDVIDYTVRSGDSLWLIAQQHETTVDEIRRLNSLTNDNLYIGQVLKVPVTPSEGEGFTYVVRSGDSLWTLAQRFGTTVDEIKRLNGLANDALSVGQELKISGTETGSGGEAEEGFAYTVHSGDTLWMIAQRFGTTVDAIRQMSSLTSDSLYVGQQLRIPGSVTAYTVRSGDSLWSIAQKYATTIDRIKVANGLTGSNLYIGQVLYII